MNGPQQKQLHAALLSAFPTYQDLEMMVLYELNESLPAIAGNSTYSHIIFELIRRTIAAGRLAELISGALQQNPHSPQLIRVAEQLNLSSTAIESLTPTASGEHKQQKPQASDHLQAYLLTLRQIVEQLPRLGLGVSDLITPSSVSLADIFIPTEFRESPKALKLLPFSQDEITAISGLDPQHKRYFMINPKGEWERTFARRDRINISTLWQCLSAKQPAAVIQGGPGTGKSTLLSRITLAMTCQGLGGADTQLSLTPTLIPMLIFIKEYADYLDHLSTIAIVNDEQKRSLLTFLIYDIKSKLEKKGVAEAKQIAQQAEQWLCAGRCLVMLEALDEVSDKTRQDEIQQASHNFIEPQRDTGVPLIYNHILIT